MSIADLLVLDKRLLNIDDIAQHVKAYRRINRPSPSLARHLFYGCAQCIPRRSRFWRNGNRWRVGHIPHAL